MPSRAGGDAAILQALRRRSSYGLSSSCHVRDVGVPPPNGPSAICSRARSSSNAGQTKNGCALAGMTHGEQPLAAAPADAGEVDERGAAGQHDRVDLLLGHQPPRLLDARAALVGGDRPAPGRASRSARRSTAATDRRRVRPAAALLSAGNRAGPAEDHAAAVEPRNRRRLIMGFVSGWMRSALRRTRRRLHPADLFHAGASAAQIISAMTSAPLVAGRGPGGGMAMTASSASSHLPPSN